MPKSKSMSTDAAREDARRLIAAGTVPTYRELSKKWGRTMQMVGYILKSVRDAQKKRTVVKKVAVVKRAPKTPPLLQRLRVAMEKVENDLQRAEGYISAIPGLGSAEIARLIKKSQASVWSGFHGELTGAAESVAKLATVRRKKRVQRKQAAKG